MANLKKTEDLTAMVFEVFELEVEESDRAELAADPSKFMTDLLKGEGVTPKAVMMDEKMLKPDPTATGIVCRVYHCKWPADQASHTITVCG